jgi:hypothetical protein
MTEFKINHAIRAGSTTYLPGMEDKLAKLLTDEQFERLKKAGHIGKPDAPRMQTFRPPVSGKSTSTSEQDAADAQAKAEADAKAAELRAQEAAAIKVAMNEDEARRNAAAESEFKSQLEGKLSDLAGAIEREGLVKVQVNETTEQPDAAAQAEAEAAAKKKADAAQRVAAHRAKLKAEKLAAQAKADAATKLAGEQAAQAAGEQELSGENK